MKKINKKINYFKIVLALKISLIMLLSVPGIVFGKICMNGTIGECPPPCPTSCSDPPPKGLYCFNGPNSSTPPLECRGIYQACGKGGTWETWKAVCVKSDKDKCDWYYEYEYSFSTADKCIDSETGLRPGICKSPPKPGEFGPTIYKRCCRESEPVACIHYSYQDPYYPPEGVCPPETKTVPCGYGEHPPCDQACTATTTPPPPPPPPSPPNPRWNGLDCRIDLFTLVNPNEGDLATDFEITYGINVTGRTRNFSWNCVKEWCDIDCYNDLSTTTPCKKTTCWGRDEITKSSSITPTCEASGRIDLKFLGIQKDWGLWVNKDLTLDGFSFNNSGGVSETYNFDNYPDYPDRHGWQEFRTETNRINVQASVNFSCPPGYSASPSGYSSNTTTPPLSSNFEFLVNPTDVIPQAPSLSSNPPHPNNVVTRLRDFIVGFQITINYGINLGLPGIFKLDTGDFWLEAPGVSFSPNPLQNTEGGRSASGIYTPSRAGSHTFCTVHDADDERSNPPNLENACTSITVYRYLCYLGYCYECSNEPTRFGGFINLLSGNCKVVEPEKCRAYIGSTCRTKGRE